MKNQVGTDWVKLHYEHNVGGFNLILLSEHQTIIKRADFKVTVE